MATSCFTSVYGPVKSWRFGRSLGIDPIGDVSTCSFNCVYCQLGTIEFKSRERMIFIPTTQIVQDLQAFDPWDVDVVTLSGSGEPTLALNLGEILAQTKALTQRPVAVLTNGTLLPDPGLRRELAIADRVAVKIDAISSEQLRRINRPVETIELLDIWAGLEEFREQYQGHLAIQTMLLTSWSEHEQANYIALMRELAPDEIQLNTPTRPRPATYQTEARGNDYAATSPIQFLKPVDAKALQEFAQHIWQATQIPVRHPFHHPEGAFYDKA